MTLERATKRIPELVDLVAKEILRQCDMAPRPPGLELLRQMVPGLGNPTARLASLKEDPMTWIAAIIAYLDERYEAKQEEK